MRSIEYAAPCPDPVVVRSIAEFGQKAVEAAGRAFHQRVHGRHPAKRPTLRHTRISSAKTANLDIDLGDFYGLLGVPLSATTDDIRRAYREVSLVYHPDKNPAAENIYKAIQEAQTTLTDARRRRVYDSSLPFNDAIPADVATIDEASFFKKFGPVFARNARFSEAQPVPLLGTADTAFADVDAFYDFWFSFKSWRDFSADCEHKPDQADNRDERRWMEKENAKVTNAKVKAEAQRIRRLVDRAFKLDPRVKAQRALEKQEKAAKKAAKSAGRFAEQKRIEEEELRRREAEEAASAAAAEDRKLAKKIAQDEKRQGRLLRKTIRETVQTRYGEIIDRGGWSVDELFQGLSMADLTAFADGVRDETTAADCICEHIRRAYDGSKPTPEVTPLSSRTTSPRSENTVVDAAPWTSQELHVLAQAMQKYTSGTNDRWTLIAKTLKGRTQDEIVEKAKLLSKDGAVSTTPPSDGWSASQHSQFEEALRNVPASVKDRWTAIAARVSGKDRSQCMKRFKALRAQLLQQAGAL